MKNITIIAVSLFSLVGCAEATSVPIVSPTGDNWIGVDCNGHSQVACYAEAGYQCPGGYDIQDNEGHFATQASGIAVPGYAGVRVGEVHSGSMIIKCHGNSRAQEEQLINACYEIFSCNDHKDARGSFVNLSSNNDSCHTACREKATARSPLITPPTTNP